MKHATSASVVAATAGATHQVHHQARIQELFSSGPMSSTTVTTNNISVEEQDKQATIATISTWLESKGSPKSSPGAGDDNSKTKSTAMSRLLAVDSDNYMLRKGVATTATTTTNNHNNITASSNTLSSSSPSNGSPSLHLQRQIQNLSAATAPILAYNNGEHVGQPYDVTRTSKSVTLASPRWYAASSNNQVTPVTVVAAATTRAQLDEQSRTTVVTATPASDNVEIELESVTCARPVSFHRHMCWCGTQQQQSSMVESVVDASLINNSNNSGSSYSNSHTKDRDLATLEGLTTSSAKRTVRNNNNNSLCCCMCGSLCPTECHACFHIVCSDYSGQHLCQWNTKGHALPGQVHDKDKVSKKKECLLFVV